MRLFVFAVFIPAIAGLITIAAVDLRAGTGTLAREIGVGIAAGLIAAIAYDIFRLPFVYSRQWGLESIVPQMDLFKVFPRFGAMILNQPIEQSHYSASAQVTGWIYHFSNGATFGVMYMALLAPQKLKEWWWGVAMAVAIEGALLLTPYSARFGITQNLRFVEVTLAAHLIFGISMGLFCLWAARRDFFAPNSLATSRN
ncbi:MAG: hypothetical protein JWM99_2450 [Verrucomicrobiales bacterium]|nr:hypothetical protein [Verrucomicrobiales bacterium]